MYTLLVWKLLELLRTPCWNQCLHPHEVHSRVLGTNEQEWLFLHHHFLIWHPSLPALVEVLLEDHLGNNKQHGNISCKQETQISKFIVKRMWSKITMKVVPNFSVCHGGYLVQISELMMFLLRQLWNYKVSKCTRSSCACTTWALLFFMCMT